MHTQRRVKASSLHLTTGTGNPQSCSPIITPLLHDSLSGHKGESGKEASIILISMECSHACMEFMNLGLDKYTSKIFSIIPHCFIRSYPSINGKLGGAWERG